LLSPFGLRDLFSSSANVGTNKKPMFAEYSRHDSKDANGLCESSEQSEFALFDVGRAIGVFSSIFPHSQVAIALPHYCPFQHSSTCTTHESTQDSERRACLSHFLCSNLDHFFKDKDVLHYHCRGRERRALQVAVISQAAQCESDYYCQCSTIRLLTCFCLSLLTTCSDSLHGQHKMSVVLR
jgi:hypothetical protein